MKNDFSFTRLAMKRLRGEKLSMTELEVTNLGEKNLRDCDIMPRPGPKAESRFSIPFSMPVNEYGDIMPRIRALDTQAYMIQSENLYLINPISEKSVFGLAGATFLAAQHRNFKVPSFSGILAQNLETDAEPEEDGATITIGGASFAPKRFYILLDFPMSLLMQGGPDVDKWIMDNISAALSARVDSVIGGITASDVTKGQGMGYAITTGDTTKVNAVSPTYDSIVALEKALGSNFGGINIPGSSPAFITNSEGRRILRKVYSGDSNTEPVWKNGKLLDNPAFVSDLVSGSAGADGAGNLLLFGNWKDLCVVQFGAYDITVDPYTLKNNGKVQLCVNSYIDVRGLRGTQSTGEATQANDYAYSFGAIAIK
ncbi:MAG TPA: phage major capsid protein [Bacteroidales bacterium]|nr:phage major capsid protein [Bacteroidales bacterium]